MEKHLKLTVADLQPNHQKEIPKSPRFFHFSVPAIKFHEADIITFEQPGKPVYVIKDKFGTYGK